MRLLSTSRKIVLLIFLLLYETRGSINERAINFVSTIHNLNTSQCLCDRKYIKQKETTRCEQLRNYFPDIVADSINESDLFHNFFHDVTIINNINYSRPIVNDQFKHVQNSGKCSDGKLASFSQENYLQKFYRGFMCDRLNNTSGRMFWDLLLCPFEDESNVVSRYIVRPLDVNEFYFFEFDMRDFKLDFCQYQSDICQKSEKCQFNKRSIWNLSINNIKCICTKKCYDYKTSFHIVPLALQVFCMITCLALGGLIYRLRTTKVFKTSNWLLLEIFLLGAIFLYSTTIVYQFHMEEWSCFMVPWLRVIGFSIMYGVLFVKIHRVLSCFQSRKAHRVYVRDKDMLKYLGVFIAIHVALMAGWTCINLDYISNSPWSEYKDSNLKMLTETDGNSRLLSYSQNDSVLVPDLKARHIVCRVLSWNIIAELIEFIMLIFAIRYCRMVKQAPNEYNEIYYITIALFTEAFISGLFHLSRHFLWRKVHPDYALIFHFLRSQFTVSFNVALIIIPKLCYAQYRQSGAISTSNFRGLPIDNQLHSYKQDVNNYAQDGEITDVNLADMDPEVIRRELKRLYAQIEIYKLKAMRKDNPHISKRRGGRKGRRFSLQTFHKKNHANQGLSSNQLNPVIQSDNLTSTTTITADKLQKNANQDVHYRNKELFNKNSHKYSSTNANAVNVHEEEVSRISEDSVNSIDETTLGKS